MQYTQSILLADKPAYIDILNETDHRYVDILLGLLLLASLLCLLWGSHSESRLWVIAFITGSLAVVLSYWLVALN